MSGSLRLLVWGVVLEVLHLFGKGLRLGFVLFLALSTLSMPGRSKSVNKYFQDRNFDKWGTGVLFMPNTMKIKIS